MKEIKLQYGFNLRKDIPIKSYYCREDEGIYLECNNKTKTYQVGVWRGWRQFETDDTKRIIFVDELEFFDTKKESFRMLDGVRALKFKIFRT